MLGLGSLLGSVLDLVKNLLGDVLGRPFPKSTLDNVDPTGTVGDVLNQIPYDIPDVPINGYISVKVGDKDMQLPLDQNLLRKLVDDNTDSDGSISTPNLWKGLPSILSGANLPNINFDKSKDSSIPASDLMSNMGNGGSLGDLVNQLPGSIDTSPADFLDGALKDSWNSPMDSQNYNDGYGSLPDDATFNDALKLIRAQGSSQNAADILSQLGQGSGSSGDSSGSSGGLLGGALGGGSSSGSSSGSSGGLLGGVLGGGSSSGSSRGSSKGGHKKSGGGGGLLGGLLG